MKIVGLAVLSLLMALPFSALANALVAPVPISDFHYQYTKSAYPQGLLAPFPYLTSKAFNFTIIYTYTTTFANSSGELGVDLDAGNATVHPVLCDFVYKIHNATLSMITCDDGHYNMDFITSAPNIAFVKGSFSNSTGWQLCINGPEPYTGLTSTTFPKYIFISSVDETPGMKVDLYLHTAVISSTEQTSFIIGSILPIMIELMIIGAIVKMIERWGK